MDVKKKSLEVKVWEVKGKVVEVEAAVQARKTILEVGKVVEFERGCES